VFEIRLYHPYRLVNPDFALFECSGAAFGEASLIPGG
jgi:hypothetical protein